MKLIPLIYHNIHQILKNDLQVYISMTFPVYPEHFKNFGVFKDISRPGKCPISRFPGRVGTMKVTYCGRSCPG